MAEQLNFYDIIKKCRGNLGMTLPSFDMTAPPRNIYIPFNGKKVRVPRTFALGIFTDPTLERMYKDGVFVVEPARQFEAEVAEIFFPIENKIVVASEAEILTALKQGNRVSIRKMIEESSVNRDNIITLATENIGDIPGSMVDDLNKMFGVDLRIEDAELG